MKGKGFEEEMPFFSDIFLTHRLTNHPTLTLISSDRSRKKYGLSMRALKVERPKFDPYKLHMMDK